MTDLTKDQLDRRAHAVEREFPETDAAFQAVREVMLERIAVSPLSAREERENLYRSIQVLDAVRRRLIDCMGIGSDALAEYVNSVRRDVKPEGEA